MVAKTARSRSQIHIVAACSARKRQPTSPELRLGSLRSDSIADRTLEWRNRLDTVDAPAFIARDLYAGDHWSATVRAYQAVRRLSPAVHLWVASAGYGLISADSCLKSYSATFADGHSDSVWTQRTTEGRIETLGRWWSSLTHEATLGDLAPRRGNGALVIVAGAAYLDALAADLRAAFEVAGAAECVSVISAGATGIAGLVPIDRRFRQVVGGTDASLNARALEWLSTRFEDHQFRPSLMRAQVQRASEPLEHIIRPLRSRSTDEEIAVEIERMREMDGGISRTRALAQLRSAGFACEQSRFAAIWGSHCSATT